jgi:hypothetical protein
VADKLAVIPAQIVAGLAARVSTGTGITVKVAVDWAVHPTALVAFTVYTVVMEGVTVSNEPVAGPGNHE